MGLIPILGLILQGYGTYKAGQDANRYNQAFERSSATQEELMKEYLQDYRAMRPLREQVGEQLKQRAASQPFYADVWGRYPGADEEEEIDPKKLAMGWR